MKVKRVVDGDTLHLSVHCGFGVWLESTIRLRGIDAPEMSTTQGPKVQAFVAEALGPCPQVVISTRSRDKYRRYLADVYCLSGEGDARRVLAEGVCLNEELARIAVTGNWRWTPGVSAGRSARSIMLEIPYNSTIP